MHADTLRVTGTEAVIAERRPPLIAVTFSASAGAPALSYLLEPRAAFEMADGIARLAMELDPAIMRELRTRTIVLPHDRL